MCCDPVSGSQNLTSCATSRRALGGTPYAEALTSIKCNRDTPHGTHDRSFQMTSSKSLKVYSDIGQTRVCTGDLEC